MTADLSRVDQWVRTVLHSDGAIAAACGGRIYADEAPLGAASPMIVFAFLGGSDKLIAFKTRFTTALYLIRAISEGASYDTVEPIADKIDDLLINAVPNQGAVVRDVRIASCIREQPHQRKDASEGVPVVYLGGFYRITYQPVTQ
jgi:hypothetical protein